MQRYHPALPSIDEAKADYTQVTSDHVPILATVPLPEGEVEGLDQLKIVSWNVLQPDSDNGFAPLTKTQFGESEEQKIARHQRIKDAIVRIVRTQKPAFLALQEVRANEHNALFKSIMAEIGDHYAITAMGKGGDAEVLGCLVLYNKHLIEPAENSPIKDFRQVKHSDLGGTKTTYRFRDNPDAVLRIVSAHPGFNNVPDSHEDIVRQYLTEEGDHAISIAIGDFNCGIAPLDAKPRNITTSATVSKHREYKLQGACAIDGCFYSDQNEEGQLVLHQAAIEPLDPNTGIVYQADELPPIDVSTLSDLQKKEILDFKMIMCIDHSFNEEKMIDGMTVFEYEEYLKTELDCSLVLVRPACNLNNDKGIGIVLPEECTAYINQKKDDRFQCRKINDQIKNANYQVIFVKKSDLPALNNEIKAYREPYNKIYNEVHKKLLEITNDYYNYLNDDAHIKDIADKNINDTKKTFIAGVSAELTSSKYQTVYEKKKAIDQVKNLIAANEHMSQYRGSDMQRYFRYMVAALAVLMMPVGVTLGAYHKIKYNTVRFWAPEGYKRKTQILNKIASAEKKAKFKK